MIFSSDIDVSLVQSNVSDSLVCDAARISTGSTGTPEKDKGLINFLMREHHGTPFEHGSMTFLVSAPIFVFREWHRHRAGWSYNEESGRYKALEGKFYMPRQAREQLGKPGAYTINENTALTGTMRLYMEEAFLPAWENYEALLDDGVAREVARMVLPVATYSSMYATCNPRSLMHFLGLRSAPEAQLEIRMAAEKLEEIFKEAMPWTYEAWVANGRVAP